MHALNPSNLLQATDEDLESKLKDLFQNGDGTNFDEDEEFNKENIVNDNNS